MRKRQARKKSTAAAPSSAPAKGGQKEAAALQDAKQNVQTKGQQGKATKIASAKSPMTKKTAPNGQAELHEGKENKQVATDGEDQVTSVATT